ncbi:MAG: RNA polymerase sigma-70 factor [Bacteroidota bacterium]|nr:RNA polymerase sigma-70 factor [Bacteroidota bacterium]
MSVYQTYSEKQLLNFFKAGDHAAFTEIYNRCWEELADAAYQRLHSHEDAEEVVQEVFVSLYVRRKEISLKTTLIAYLKTALKYKVIDAYRTQQLHYKHIDNIIKETLICDPQPDEQLSLKQLNNDILEIIDKLPAKCREVFIKSRFEHLSHQYIADKLGITVSTVKKHLHKATQILRKELNRDQFDLIIICVFFWHQIKG